MRCFVKLPALLELPVLILTGGVAFLASARLGKYRITTASPFLNVLVSFM